MISNTFLGSKSHSNKKLSVNFFNLSISSYFVISKRIICSPCNNSLKNLVVKLLKKSKLLIIKDGLVVILNLKEEVSYFTIFDSGEKILFCESIIFISSKLPD